MRPNHALQAARGGRSNSATRFTLVGRVPELWTLSNQPSFT
jgi:hypothetical protein